MEVTKVIKNDIGDKNFSILIDEARDCSIKEQMAVIVRFLDDHGVLQERFLAIKHITDCTSAGIKKALVDVLEYHGLSTSRLRGQGYDGAFNMRGNSTVCKNWLEMKLRMHFMFIALLTSYN